MIKRMIGFVMLVGGVLFLFFGLLPSWISMVKNDLNVLGGHSSTPAPALLPVLFEWALSIGLTGFLALAVIFAGIGFILGKSKITGKVMESTVNSTTGQTTMTEEKQMENATLIVPDKVLDDIVELTTNGTTPLYRAAKEGQTEIVKQLIAKNFDVNAKKLASGTTALWIAAQKGHIDVIKLLLEKGADINTKANTGVTPLMIAAAAGHTKVVKLLLENGADANIKDNDLKTALLHAEGWGHTEIIKLLEKGGITEE
jgi:hypothetical protein